MPINRILMSFNPAKTIRAKHIQTSAGIQINESIYGILLDINSDKLTAEQIY